MLITSDSILRAGQRSISSLTGGQETTVCLHRGNVASISFRMRDRSFSVFSHSSTIVCLNSLRCDSSFPLGKLGRKFTSACFGRFILEWEDSLSGWLLLLLPALSATSVHPARLILLLKFPILNLSFSTHSTPIQTLLRSDMDV